jgi:hypothetical protein
MNVDVIHCPTCSVWIVIEPLETQQPRGKHCPNCDAVFSFINAELRMREVPNELGFRGYFADSEIK